MKVATIPILGEEELEDYSKHLSQFGIDFRKNGGYYEVGQITQVQGWILDISVVKNQVHELAKSILPTLMDWNVPFKIVANAKIADAVLYGKLGVAKLGQIISVYPQTDEKALALAKELILLTQVFQGPAIPTNKYLGGTIYTRYGGFEPIRKTDPDGRMRFFIRNFSGDLVEDIPTIPFSIPKHVDWPFSDIALPISDAPGKTLINKYRIVSCLKSDVKGMVTKALRMYGIWFQWCVIKEAKKNMWMDGEGRDTTKRLEWQYYLHKSLNGKINLPKIYDFFQAGDDTYLVMEYIKGRSLEEAVFDCYSSRPFFDLKPAKQQLLFDYLLNLVTAIEDLHREGFVHRDITPANFLIKRDGDLYMIDLELTYSTILHSPSPPFGLGTYGYMSPEQRAKMDIIPDFKEDVYALGGVMVFIFTSLLPSKFNQDDNERWRANLQFLIRSEKLCDLMARCMSHEAEARPSLSEVRDQLKAIKQAPSFGCREDINISTKIIYSTVEAGMRFLFDDLALGSEKIWCSTPNPRDIVKPESINGHAYYPWVYSGISGIMYTVARCKDAGFEIDDSLMVCYYRNYERLKLMSRDSKFNSNAGLYFGATGIALGISSGIKSGLLHNAEEERSIIARCIGQNATTCDVAMGIAGQGLLLLNCHGYVGESLFRSTLDVYVSSLIAQQQHDGSWTRPSEDGRNTFLKITGFSYGVTGILIFLLQYYRYTNDNRVVKPIENGLLWLKKVARRNGTFLLWYVNDKVKIFDWSFENGQAGILFCFTMAYDVLKHEEYRVTSKVIAESLPLYPLHNDLTFSTGLAGIGEVLLEAYRVFNNEQFMERAQWVAGVLVNTCKYTESVNYWVTENGQLPSGDLMRASSGPLNFLIRNCNQRIAFPLMPN